MQTESVIHEDVQTIPIFIQTNSCLSAFSAILSAFCAQIRLEKV